MNRPKSCSGNCIKNDDGSFSKRAIIFIVVTCLIFLGCQLFFLRMALREKNSTLAPRLKILNLRISMIFPAYSFVSFLVCIFPIAEPVIDSVGGMFEGLSFYSYAKFLLFNAGGYSAIQSVVHEGQLNVMLWLLLQFMVLRPLLLVVSGIIEMVAPDAHSAYQVFYFLSVFSTILGVIAVIRIHRSFASKSLAFNPERKICSVKIYVLLLIIQNAIVNLLAISEDELLNERRFFGLIASLEACIFIIALPYLFGTPSAKNSTVTPTESLAIRDPEIPSEGLPCVRDTIIDEHPFQFVCRLLRIWEVTFDAISVDDSITKPAQQPTSNSSTEGKIDPMKFCAQDPQRIDGCVGSVISLPSDSEGLH